MTNLINYFFRTLCFWNLNYLASVMVRLWSYLHHFWLICIRFLKVFCKCFSCHFWKTTYDSVSFEVDFFWLSVLVFDAKLDYLVMSLFHHIEKWNLNWNWNRHFQKMVSTLLLKFKLRLCTLKSDFIFSRIVMSGYFYFFDLNYYSKCSMNFALYVYLTFYTLISKIYLFYLEI